MKVIFDKLAILELDDASEFYELEVLGLSAKFREEVKKGIRTICEFPDAWIKDKGDVRRYILHKFPYKIIYSIENDNKDFHSLLDLWFHSILYRRS